MPDHLISMKRKPSERDDDAPVMASDDRNDFPLTIHLGSFEVEKLGLSGIELGDERTMVADVKVTSMSSHQSEGDDEKNENVTLSVRSAAVTSTKVGKSQAERLFGND